MTPRLVTTKQAAEMLATSPDTVRRLARGGALTRVRITPRAVRYMVPEIEELIKNSSYNTRNPY